MLRSSLSCHQATWTDPQRELVEIFSTWRAIPSIRSLKSSTGNADLSSRGSFLVQVSSLMAELGFFPTSDKKAGRVMWRGQNSWAGNHWLCLHRRNRKWPESLTCWNYRSSQISLLCTPGQKHMNPNVVTDCVQCKRDTQVHPAVPAVPASPPGATTKPGLFWLLRADTKPWAGVCCHLHRPVLSCPLQSFTFLVELCCAYGNTVSHSSAWGQWGQLSADRLPKESKNQF